ncbi:hypothetical protein JCM3765_006423 [Sporobolomyces pararoseus]
MESPYDPPIRKSSGRSRSNSFSASSAPSPAVFNERTRRQSFSTVPTSDPTSKPSLALSDDEASPKQPLIDLEENFRRSLDGPQDPADAAADRAVQREGRQSKQQRLEENPNYHATADMENFMAQIYDLTHTIDALDNDIDEIVAMRNKIVSLKPSVDVGQVSLQADLHALAALTTDCGKRIVSLETWLTQLHKWSKEVKKLIKSGKAGETMAEVGEIKFELANAKLDFAAAMERIREGAYKEQQKRERTRIWMARHIRAREPEIEDKDVKGLLKAAELGAADGVAESHVTSYAGLWALQNPFTELAELTNGMRFLHDELDREIVDHVTGKDQPKRIIYINGIYSRGRPNLSSRSSAANTESSKKSFLKPTSWFGSTPASTNATPQGPARGGTDFDGKFRYAQAQIYASEKDLEYGFARQQQLDRLTFRKKMIIALLLVIIAAIILFVSLATMRIPGETSSLASAALRDPSSTFVWGQPETTTVEAVTTRKASALETSEGHTVESDTTEEGSTIRSVLSQTSVLELPSSIVSNSLAAPTSTRNVVNLGSTSLTSSPIAGAVSSSSSIVWWTPETTAAPQVAQPLAASVAQAQPSILPATIPAGVVS